MLKISINRDNKNQGTSTRKRRKNKEESEIKTIKKWEHIGRECPLIIGYIVGTSSLYV